MEKTKLGISVGLLGAALFFGALCGGYVFLLVLAGYVLLFEANEWLKKAAVKAVVLSFAFSVFSSALGLIPSLFRWLSDFLELINLNISFSFIINIVNLLTSAIYIVEVICFLALGLKALKMETVAISSVDEMVAKHMGEVKAEAKAEEPKAE